MKKFTKALSVAGLLMCATVGLTACGGENNGGGNNNPPAPGPSTPVVYTIDQAIWDAQLAGFEEITNFTITISEECEGDTRSFLIVRDGNKTFEQEVLPDACYEQYEEKFTDGDVDKIKTYIKQENGSFAYDIDDYESVVEDFDRNNTALAYVAEVIFDEAMLDFASYEYDEASKSYKFFSASIEIDGDEKQYIITNLEFSISFEDGVIKNITAKIESEESIDKYSSDNNYTIENYTLTAIFTGTVTLPENATPKLS